jgi:hypothetical protein
LLLLRELSRLIGQRARAKNKKQGRDEQNIFY